MTGFSAVKPGARFAIKGTVTPVARHASVRLQRQTPGSAWVSIATTRTDVRGHYKFSVRAGSPGATYYRVQFLAGAKARATSPVVQRDVLGSVTRAIPAAGLVDLTTDQATGVSGDPNGVQQFTLAPGTPVPAAGAIVRVRSPGSPVDVLLARVTGTSTAPDGASTTVATTAVPLSEAYSQFTTHSVIPVPTPVSVDRSKPAMAAATGAVFKCQGDNGVMVDPVAVDLSSLNADFDLDIRSRSVHMVIVGQPRVTVGGSIQGHATCSADFLFPPIPLGATGMTLVLGPTITLDLKGGLSAKVTYTQRFAVGFDAAPGHPAQAIHGSSAVVSPTMEGSGEASILLGLKAQLGVAGRVGVEGTLGPEVGAKAVASSDTAETCVTVDIAVALDLGIYADIWVTNWHLSVAKARYTLGTIYNRCLTSKPATSEGSSGSVRMAFTAALFTQDRTQSSTLAGMLTMDSRRLRTGQTVSITFHTMAQGSWPVNCSEFGSHSDARPLYVRLLPEGAPVGAYVDSGEVAHLSTLAPGSLVVTCQNGRYTQLYDYKGSATVTVTRPDGSQRRVAAVDGLIAVTPGTIEADGKVPSGQLLPMTGTITSVTGDSVVLE